MESIVKFTRSSKGINVVLRKESEEIIVSKEMVEKILVALKACQSVKGKSHGGKRKSVLRKGMLEKKDPVISRKSYQPIGFFSSLFLSLCGFVNIFFLISFFLVSSC